MKNRPNTCLGREMIRDNCYDDISISLNSEYVEMIIYIFIYFVNIQQWHDMACAEYSECILLLSKFWIKICNFHYLLIFFRMYSTESIKTTSMETVSAGVLDKNKAYYWRSKDTAENDMMYQDIYNCICQNTKKWRYTIHYVRPTVQLLFKSRFPKGGPTCRRQVVNPRPQTPQWQEITPLLD